jgi:hypothetical protein
VSFFGLLANVLIGHASIFSAENDRNSFVTASQIVRSSGVVHSTRFPQPSMPTTIAEELILSWPALSGAVRCSMPLAGHVEPYHAKESFARRFAGDSCSAGRPGRVVF